MLADGAHFGDDVIRGGLSLGTGLPDGAGHLVAPGAEFVALGDGGAALGIQEQDLVEAVVVLGAADEGGADGVGFVAD